MVLSDLDQGGVMGAEGGRSSVVKYAYIDAMRGVAILLVVATHVFSLYLPRISEIPSWLAGFGFESARGVQLFYVLSALTMFMSMKSRFYNESNFIRNFFIRRFFRIAPLYYLAAGYYLAFTAEPYYGLKNGIMVYTFTNWLDPRAILSVPFGGWSITVEMTFYLLAPLLFVWITGLGRALYALAISIMLGYGASLWVSTSGVIGDAELARNYAYFFFPAQLPVFVAGIALYFLIAGRKDAIDWSRLTWPFLVILGLVFANFTFDSRIIPKHMIFGGAFMVLVFILSHNPVKLFVNRATIFFGKISFSLYLVHYAVVLFSQRFMATGLIPSVPLNYVVRYVCVLAVSTVISMVTYRLVEVFGQRVGSQLIAILPRRRTILLLSRPVTKVHNLIFNT